MSASLLARLRGMGGLFGWIWETFEVLIEEGQDWLVVSLVGACGREAK